MYCNKKPDINKTQMVIKFKILWRRVNITYAWKSKVSFFMQYVFFVLPIIFILQGLAGTVVNVYCKIYVYKFMLWGSYDVSKIVSFYSNFVLFISKPMSFSKNWIGFGKKTLKSLVVVRYISFALSYCNNVAGLQENTILVVCKKTICQSFCILS